MKKRILALFTAAVAGISSVSSVSGISAASEASEARGGVDAEAIVLLLQTLHHVSGTPFAAGDVNGDGSVDVIDALQILRCVVGLPNILDGSQAFPAETIATLARSFHSDEETLGELLRALARQAALIVAPNADAPSVADALQILRRVTGLTNSIDGISLRFDFAGITNEILAEMTADGRIPQNVEHLSLRGNSITDLSPLAALTNLKSLNVEGGRNSVTNLSPLSGLTELESLIFGINSFISDISPLSELTNLTHLEIQRAQHIRDFSPLAALTNLTHLVATFARPADGLTALAGLTNLRVLELYCFGIAPVQPTTDLTPLAGLVNLEELDLEGSRVEDISALAGMTNLRELNLRRNQVRDTAPLGELRELREMDLIGNPISSLVLRDFPHLTTLRAGADVINVANISVGSHRDLTVELVNLPSLRRVVLNGLGISDLSQFAAFPELTQLVLQRNNISDLSPLIGLTRLELLRVDGNPLGGINSREIREILPLLPENARILS
jgi:Leucine-rich repeat (LRR) protein